jgi:hypothetical protein
LAGLEVAKQLCVAGADDVLVVEAGPESGPAHVGADPIYPDPVRLWLQPRSDPHFWRPWDTMQPPHYAGVAGLRRRLGGRSLYWHGVTLPVDSWALRAPWWPAEVVRDLTVSHGGGPSLYAVVAAELDRWVGDRGADSSQHAIRIGTFRFERTPRAVRTVAAPIPGWEAYSALPELLAGLGDGAVRILVNTAVESLHLRDGSVRSATVSSRAGDRAEIACERVVLAGGTVENARLAVTALPDRRRAHAGRFLVDKVTQGFTVALRWADRPSGWLPDDATGAAFLLPGAAAFRSNILLNIDRVGDRAIVNIGSMGEQFPDRENAVLLRGSARPPAVNATTTSPDDLLIADQRVVLQDLWAALRTETGLRDGGLRWGDFRSAATILEQVLPLIRNNGPVGKAVGWSRPLGTEYHEAGTLAFGRSIDERHELHGARGVHRRGACVLPTQRRGQPVVDDVGTGPPACIRHPGADHRIVGADGAAVGGSAPDARMTAAALSATERHLLRNCPSGKRSVHGFTSVA